MYTLGELADHLDLALSGDADKPIEGLASIANAGPAHLTFLAEERHLPQTLREW